MHLYSMIKGKFRYLFLVPALVIFAVVIFYPILRCFHLSFTDTEEFGTAKGTSSGFKNYSRALKDEHFGQSLINTSIFTGFSLSAELLIGLFLALMLNKAFRGRGIVRAIVLIPWALPPAVMAMGWKWIFNDTYGVASDLLVKTGITNEPVAWLALPKLAMFSIIVADVWKTAPFVAIILLAGLQSIPKELYEAASIDGAKKLKQFTMVTLPLLRPYILLAILFRGIQAFGVFDLIWVLTRGGPGGSTETVSLNIYDTTFRYLNLGYAATLTVIVFIILAVVALVISLLHRRQYQF